MKTCRLHRPVAQWVFLVALGLPTLAFAQGVLQEREKLPDLNKSASWHNQDYFKHATDPEVAKLLADVETNHLGKGFQGYMAKRAYHYALEDLRYVLRVFPNHPTALQLMGVVASLTKAQTIPLPWYERAIALFPSHAITRAQYGRYLAQVGSLDRATDELEQAVAQEPGLAAGHAWLAQVRSQRGDLEGAREVAKRARELGYQGKILEQ